MSTPASARIEDIRERVTDSSHQQAAALERVATSVARLGDMVEQTFALVRAQTDRAERVSETTERGRSAIAGLDEQTRAIESLARQLDEVVGVIRTIEKRSALIDDLAHRAAILSVNASIESARAGEHGAGFAIVAAEVRAMSKQTRDAAGEIASLVSEGARIVEAVARTATDHASECAVTTAATRDALASVDAVAEEILTSARGMEDLCAEHKSTAQVAVGAIQHSIEDNSRRVSELIGALTGASVEDISPQACIPRLGELSIVDVRRPDEWRGELGRIRGARLETLDDDFERRVATLPRGPSYLFVCRSGGRSARAARIALAAGHQTVLNLEGGMLRWNELGYATERG